MGLIGFTNIVELKQFHGQNMFVQRMGNENGSMQGLFKN